MTETNLNISRADQCGLGRRRWVASAGVWLALLAGAAFAAPAAKSKPAEKGTTAAQAPTGPLRFPLSAMGYQPLKQDFLLSGSSMLTVHFVDRDHLLVTFGVRRLMKREPEDPASGEDRVIGANLVELPSGKVLAQTEWRVHDRSQYLWPLGHGRFLLRVRDRLSMIAPVAGGANDAFHAEPLLKLEGHIVAILTSPDQDLLTVETTRYAMASGEATAGFSFDPAPVDVGFYRLVDSGPGGDGLTVAFAGRIRTQSAIALPLNSAGRLNLVADGKDRWLFNFNEHAGKVDELAGFATTCSPRPTLVGHGEFVAFGCHGGAGSIDLAGFNMKGEEMWQQNLSGTHIAPTFGFAPEAGRFALGRTLVSGNVDADTLLPAGIVTGQEVRVYQTYSGRQIFKIDCTPVQRAGQNFALSEDGMRLAVVREAMVRHAATPDYAAYTEGEAGVEIYTLPPLSPEDQAAVKEAQQRAPLDTGARIDQALARTLTANEKPGPPEPPSPVAAASQPADAAASSAAQTPPAAETVEEGDVQPTGPRKRPTLYGPEDTLAPAGARSPAGNKPQ